MKKLILASVFVLGATFAVSAQTSDNKSCHSDKGTTSKSCCQSSNSTSVGNTTTNTTTKKSCCSEGGMHHSSTNGTEGTSTVSASAIFHSNRANVVTTEAPKK